MVAMPDSPSLAAARRRKWLWRAHEATFAVLVVTALIGVPVTVTVATLGAGFWPLGGVAVAIPLLLVACDRLGEAAATYGGRA